MNKVNYLIYKKAILQNSKIKHKLKDPTLQNLKISKHPKDNHNYNKYNHKYKKKKSHGNTMQIMMKL